jgi:hypothetical protein
MEKHEFPSYLFKHFGQGGSQKLPPVEINGVQFHASVRQMVDHSMAEGELGWLRLVEPVETSPDQPCFLEFYETREGALGGDKTQVRYALFQQPTRFGPVLVKFSIPLDTLPENCRWGITALDHVQAFSRITLIRDHHGAGT